MLNDVDVTATREIRVIGELLNPWKENEVESDKREE